MEKEKDIAIVYMVAGISKRFNGNIKQFAQVGPNGESLIEYSLNQALPAGFSKIYFIVGNTTVYPFRKKFGNNYRGIPINYAMQIYYPDKRDRPWGTADAVASLRGKIDCPFVICNGDNIYGESTFRILFEHLRRSEEEATLGYKLGDVLGERAGNRAIFTTQNGYVQSLREMIGLERERLPQGISLEDLCSKNIFALHPRIIDILYEKVEDFKRENRGNRTTEYILSNALSDILGEGKIRMKIYPAVEECLDVTRQEDVEVVRERLKEELKL